MTQIQILARSQLLVIHNTPTGGVVGEGENNNYLQNQVSKLKFSSTI